LLRRRGELPKVLAGLLDDVCIVVGAVGFVSGDVRRSGRGSPWVKPWEKAAAVVVFLLPVETLR
jgi:hypothetical protein